MAQFKQHGTIAEFQEFIRAVYGLPDDRLYSIEDLLTHTERFAMRALKGIRKKDSEKQQKINQEENKKLFHGITSWNKDYCN